MTIMRQCCCGGDGIDCPTWCECLPTNATLTFHLSQGWEQVVDGSVKDSGTMDLSVSNVKLIKYNDEAGDCYLVNEGGTGNGTFSYSYYDETFLAPMYDYLQPSCPGGCKIWNLATTYDRTASGNLDAGEISIQCYDPCNVPLGYGNVTPTTTVFIDIIATVTHDYQCHGEYLATVCGTNMPPYTLTENLVAKIFGKPQCVTTSVFSTRTVEWINSYDAAYPHVTGWLCTTGCTGACKPAFDCKCANASCTGAKIPIYDYWNRYDVDTCTANKCFDTHSCWTGSLGPPGTLVYECTCNYSGDSGTGNEFYRHWMQSTITLTIP